MGVVWSILKQWYYFTLQTGMAFNLALAVFSFIETGPVLPEEILYMWNFYTQGIEEENDGQWQAIRNANVNHRVTWGQNG